MSVRTCRLPAGPSRAGRNRQPRRVDHEMWSMTSIGRIDPVTHHPDGTPIDPDAPASPEVLRELHADLVRGKRRGVLTSLPMAMAAIAALVAGGMNPHLFGPFISVGLVGLGGFASEAQEWLALRRANPLTLQAEEARERLDRQVFGEDFRARRQGGRPVARRA